MKIPALVAIFLLASTALFAQNRGVVSSGGISRPAAVSAARPAVPTAVAPQQHTVGSVLYPAGAVPPVNAGLPFVNTSIGHVGPGRDRPRAPRSSGFVYSYPFYTGGGYYGSPYDSSYVNQGAPAGGQEQPNVVVVYPPPAPPVIINQYGSDNGQMATRVQPQNLYYPPAPEDAAAPSTATDATHYIIAFKDHSIYSAVAYWVDGDTLHYFTTPTTHNQASVALVDRDLTQRLNQESGVEVKLPPAR
jgi:hypothetical protein